MSGKKIREWNLVVNEEAECFKDLENRLIEEQNCFWSVIYHDKDISEQGELKKGHFHVVLKYENGRTFETMQKKFAGAHLSECLSFKSSLQYLTHKNDKSKYQYEFEEIKTNNPGLLKEYMGNRTYEVLTLEKLLEDFMLDLPHFLMKYGVEQYQKNRTAIQDLKKDIQRQIDKQVMEDNYAFNIKQLSAEVDNQISYLKGQIKKLEKMIEDQELPF